MSREVELGGVKVDLKLEADRFWNGFDEYLEQAHPGHRRQLLRNEFMEFHRGMVENPNLDELEDLAKKIHDYFQEDEMKRAVQLAEAASAAGANSSQPLEYSSHTNCR
eukprot:s451_g2.t1